MKLSLVENDYMRIKKPRMVSHKILQPNISVTVYVSYQLDLKIYILYLYQIQQTKITEQNRKVYISQELSPKYKPSERERRNVSVRKNVISLS